MFTGLIRTCGRLLPATGDRLQIVLPASATDLITDLAYGDSIAVDGVCLTVETRRAGGFVASVSPETLQRTNLGWRDRAAARVNIEPALRVGDKLGGHFVSGHIDGVGALLASMPTASAWEMTFGPVAERREQWQQVARYLISKGSIAVNGVSLTIAACTDEWFKVAAIPATYRETNLSLLEPGNWVNLESDILGKYVAKLVGAGRLSGSAASDPTRITTGIDSIDAGFLAEHGYV